VQWPEHSEAPDAPATTENAAAAAPHEASSEAGSDAVADDASRQMLTQLSSKLAKLRLLVEAHGIRM